MAGTARHGANIARLKVLSITYRQADTMNFSKHKTAYVLYVTSQKRDPIDGLQ